jgi:hypothetical protein
MYFGNQRQNYEGHLELDIGSIREHLPQDRESEMDFYGRAYVWR